MAIPPSNPPIQISMSDIRSELGLSISPFSLNTAETGGYVPLNQSSAYKPDGLNPNAMSEWYNYDHTATTTTPPNYDIYLGAISGSLGPSLPTNACSVNFTIDESDNIYIEAISGNQNPSVGDRLYDFTGTNPFNGYLQYYRIGIQRLERIDGTMPPWIVAKVDSNGYIQEEIELCQGSVNNDPNEFN